MCCLRLIIDIIFHGQSASCWDGFRHDAMSFGGMSMVIGGDWFR